MSKNRVVQRAHLIAKNTQRAAKCKNTLSFPLLNGIILSPVSPALIPSKKVRKETKEKRKENLQLTPDIFDTLIESMRNI